MTRRIIGLAIVAIVAMPAARTAAQLSAFGVKGGATFSTASVEDAGGAEIKYRTSFGGGIFFNIPLGGVSLQPEALYMKKGAKVSDADFGGVEVNLSLDYIEIPLLLVVPIGPATATAPYVFGGGAIAFEAGCKFSGEGGGLSFDVDCDDGGELDLELERKKLDYGAVIGAGLRIPAGAGAVLLEGRYTFGLANLDDTGDSGEGFKNRSAAAFIGYSFTLGR